MGTNKDTENESLDKNTKKGQIPQILLLPEPLREWWEKTSALVSKFRSVAFSFVAGSIFATAAIIIPIYNGVETLSKPVTLFETILSDLEQGYVDPVDTNKLFETGVSAMLRSLDPYTEYEGPQEAVELTESIDGKYGGVGLVISGTSRSISSSNPAQQQNTPSGESDQTLDGQPMSSSSSKSSIGITGGEDLEDDDDLDEEELFEKRKEERFEARAQQKGIRVVNAFENYAFDYGTPVLAVRVSVLRCRTRCLRLCENVVAVTGMRVGDKLVAIDEKPITPYMTVENVRNMLRGEPGTLVSISFERDGVSGLQTVTMPRSVVSLRDVKLATLLGDPKDGIGYIQLSGFTSEAGREMRNAIRYLQRSAEDVAGGSHYLRGLVLDLRGNPGGLLSSAVDVTSLLVPKGSDIVSAKGRGFPGVLYRSRVDPILDQNTKLAILINRSTASAAEIVSGAVQDLDVGIILGEDRTYGKGLVQNVEELPFGTALKFTVAKYYTPSGRCIQGINYQEGGGLREEDMGFKANKIPKKDRSIFRTKNGRVVRDGGGIEADFKVESSKVCPQTSSVASAGAAGAGHSHRFPHFTTTGSSYAKLGMSLPSQSSFSFVV